ncbi:hypothetical protein LTR62_000246 [Meristemomyces frigidus]|uniref:Peptidase S26 domain-containing protein n=1 Tax=Meristemomyces frigidus TaxID=1508187 RepID=A0AAN7YK56_9PEZI|nr:hypothetical protein LTR62_000246 [Meristemomyces frigidus]
MLRSSLTRLRINRDASILLRLVQRSRLASSKTPPKPNAFDFHQKRTSETIVPPASSQWTLSSFVRPLPDLGRIPSNVAAYLFCACIAFHIFSEYGFVLEGAYGISMLPTIASDGDWLWISKYYRRGRDLKVGDVVSFRHPIRPGEYAVKRIIGMPGDFVLRDTPEKGHMMMQVPNGHCWLVGDNLTYSRDSRMFGMLPLALITGKVLGPVRWSGWTIPYLEKLEHGLQPAVLDDGDVE